MFLVYLAISSLLPLDQATFSKRRQSFSFALFPIQLNFELVTKFNTLHLVASVVPCGFTEGKSAD